MKEDERKEKGLVKELKYRYAFASGDFNFLQEKENTNYLRALARLGIRMDNGENDKYFTPESIMEIKKKKKNSNYNTTLINPIYISDFQAPLEDYEIITSGGGPLYDDNGNQIGTEPIVETKKVTRPAERRITPADVQLGLEGAGGTVNTTIPPEGTDNSIKKLKVAFATTWSPQIGSNQASAGVEIYTKPDGSFQKSQMGPDDDFNSSTSFTFDAFGYITVSGIKYSAIQVISPDESLTALQSLRNRKDPDLDRLIDAWGLSESDIPTPVTPEEGGEREAPQAEDGEEQPTNATADEVANTTANSSLMEKISRLRGWKVSDDGQVQKDKKGNPIVVDKDPQISLGKSAEVTIDASGNVSIKGDVTINIPSKSDKVKLIENGKFAIPFGTIEGNFLCRKVGLTTLVGCPKVVKGTFDCSNNQITTLAGAPDEVGIFIANNNKSLASLTGGPKKINGITDTAKSQKEHIYDVSSCALTSLDGNGITSFGPGGFNCGNNKITSLSGLGVVTTTGVTRFDCSKNVLTSLVGAPKTVKDAKTGKPGNYDISGNKDITSFPTSMADIEVDDFKASGLSLSSLSFAPKQVYGNFDCSGNNGKKLTNQSIGKDRFKIGGGFEEDAGNRIVKIDGDFITSEGSWNVKIYDINVIYKKPEMNTTFEFNVSTSGQLIKLGVFGIQFTESINPASFKIIYNIRGEYTNAKGATHWEFECFRGIGNPGTNPYNSTWTAKYAKGRKSPFGNFRTWDQFNSGLRNFINWSMFERGDAGWGWAQPTGAFIVNGVNYGAKTAEGARKYASFFAITPSGPKLGLGKDFWSDGAGSEVDSTKAVLTAKTIKYGAPGSALAIKNGVAKSWTPEELVKLGFDSATTFIGYTKSGKWFAGENSVADVGKAANAINDYYNQKKDPVQACGFSDGSASRSFALNGRQLSGGGRPIPILIAWDNK
jgi:hypothetical protein